MDDGQTLSWCGLSPGALIILTCSPTNLNTFTTVKLLDPKLHSQLDGKKKKAAPGAYQAYEETYGTNAEGNRQAFALRREYGRSPWHYGQWRKRERTYGP